MSKKGPSNGVTKEMLMEMYHGNEDTSLQEVADALGVSRETVKRWCTHFDVPIKNNSRYAGKRMIDKRFRDKEWLANELSTKSQKAIAREANVDAAVVAYWARRHGLHNKNKSATVKEGLKKAFPNGRKGKNSSGWQGGRYVVKPGYVVVYAVDHPYAKNNKIFEHRLVMEQKLGRYLEPGEIVHHIDGNKQNNHPDNLELKTNGEHIADHWLAGHEVDKLRKHIKKLEDYMGITTQTGQCAKCKGDGEVFFTFGGAMCHTCRDTYEAQVKAGWAAKPSIEVTFKKPVNTSWTDLDMEFKVS